MKIHLAALAAGFFLDLLLGDPHSLPHPVRAVGGLIEKTERILRGIFPKTAGGELLGGALLAAAVLAVTGGAVLLFLSAAAFLGAAGRFLSETLLTYYLLAARSLRDESMKVYEALERGSLTEARYAVSMIVGRDTDRLDEKGVARAAVETVAENSSDGVIAPLFYLALGGPLFGWLYKAVNTMDSMVGYRNQRYLYFGRAAARLDDLMNFVPSRLSALLLVAAAFLLGMDGPGAFFIWRRDRRKHKSPNSAQTEAACAGALGLRLAGDAWYFGQLHKKPFIGEEKRPVEYEDIKRVNRLMLTAAFLAFVLALLLRLALLSL